MNITFLKDNKNTLKLEEYRESILDYPIIKQQCVLVDGRGDIALEWDNDDNLIFVNENIKSVIKDNKGDHIDSTLLEGNQNDNLIFTENNDKDKKMFRKGYDIKELFNKQYSLIDKVSMRESNGSILNIVLGKEDFQTALRTGGGVLRLDGKKVENVNKGTYNNILYTKDVSLLSIEELKYICNSDFIYRLRRNKYSKIYFNNSKDFKDIEYFKRVLKGFGFSELAVELSFYFADVKYLPFYHFRAYNKDYNKEYIDDYYLQFDNESQIVKEIGYLPKIFKGGTKFYIKKIKK